MIDDTPADLAQQSVLSAFRIEQHDPYRNLRMLMISNDGAFAKIVLCADLRTSADQDWQGYAGTYQLKRVSGRWEISVDPIGAFGGSFRPVTVVATEQALENARSAAEEAAVEARKALRFSVIDNSAVIGDEFLSREQGLKIWYWKISLQASSGDGKQHRVTFRPELTATLRQCADPEVEGTSAGLQLTMTMRPQGEEVIGPQQAEFAYAFRTVGTNADGAQTFTVFGYEKCQALENIRDLRVNIDKLDGVYGDVMKRVEQLAFSSFATPAPGGLDGVPQPGTGSGSVSNIQSAAPSTTAAVMNQSGGQTLAAAAPPSEDNATGVVAGPTLVLAGPGIAVLLLTGFAAFLYTSRGRRRGRIAVHAGVARPQRGSQTPPDSREREIAQSSNAVANAVSERGPEAGANTDAASHDLAVDETGRTTFVYAPVDAPIEVRCFGAPCVLSGDTIVWPSREFSQEGKAIELLLFLAASPPEGVDRDTVAEAMWPEGEIADLGSSLRQLRSRLRRMTARVVSGLSDQAPFLPDFGRAYRLDPQVVHSDVHQFVRMSRHARSGGNDAISQLEQARAIYQADLFDSPAAPPFSWAIDPGTDGTTLRQQYRQTFQANTRLLADLYVRTGELGQLIKAIALYEELLRSDPLDEEVSRALLKALDVRGDRTGIEREWRRLCQALRSADPSAKPRLDTTELYQRVTQAS